MTNYQYASNEPIANVDMDGLEAIGSTVASSVGDAVVKSSSFMPNIVVQGLSHAAKSSGSFFSVAGSFFKGVGNNLWGAVKGVVHAVAHLDKTIEGIGSLSTPVGSAMAGLAIYNGVNSEIDRFKNGNAETKAAIIGAGVGEVLQLLGGEVAQVGKVGKLAKVAEISEDVGKVAEAAKGVTSLVQANRTAGNLFRDELAAALRAEGRTVRTEAYKWTPFGKRYIDIDVRLNGVKLGGIETKVGSSRYLPLQKLKDAWLGANGYPVQLVRKPANW